MWRQNKPSSNFLILITVFAVFVYSVVIKEKNKPTKEYQNVVAENSQNNEFFKTENVHFRLVTAFSDNHLNEAITSCTSLSKLPEIKNWQNGFMIAYLLENITTDRINTYQKACPFVEIRHFNFDAYPKYVRNLLEYRWKPLIVNEMLLEFEYIFYFDTITAFNETATNVTIKDFFLMQQSHFLKCGMRQFVNTTHTIFAATHPRTYELLNFDPEMAKKRNMYMAGFLTIKRNENAINIINDWIKCACEEFCMAPANSSLTCDGPKLLKGEYAECHRYDQAVLAILLVQHCGNANNYFLESPLIYPKLF